MIACVVASNVPSNRPVFTKTGARVAITIVPPEDVPDRRPGSADTVYLGRLFEMFVSSANGVFVRKIFSYAPLLDF